MLAELVTGARFNGSSPYASYLPITRHDMSVLPSRGRNTADLARRRCRYLDDPWLFLWFLASQTARTKGTLSESSSCSRRLKCGPFATTREGFTLACFVFLFRVGPTVCLNYEPRLRAAPFPAVLIIVLALRTTGAPDARFPRSALPEAKKKGDELSVANRTCADNLGTGTDVPAAGPRLPRAESFRSDDGEQWSSNSSPFAIPLRGRNNIALVGRSTM